jgi:DNA-binding transcriptional MerR regulator
VDRNEAAGGPLIPPGAAGALLGVTAKTLRRWHEAGLIGAQRTLGGHRRYWELEIRARVAELSGAAG